MAKKKGQTKEELRQANVDREYQDLVNRLHMIPDPTYHFNPGDSVAFGNLRDVVVKETLHDGKIYLLDYTKVDNNYGHPIRHEHQKQYVKWVDVRKPPITTASLIQNNDLRLQYANRSLSDLFNKAYKSGVDVSPIYQRGYVWELSDKVALIDSIFHNVDIGKFVFISLPFEANKPAYELLDGKQRMEAILAFYEDRFPYQGKFFSDLSARDQDHFTEYSMSYAEIREISEEQKIRYFLMLNTSGKAMSPEHLAKVQSMLDELENK